MFQYYNVIINNFFHMPGMSQRMKGQGNQGRFDDNTIIIEDGEVN